MKRLLVTGGGIAGLAAAWSASRMMPSLEVILVERSKRLGGKIRTDQEGGFLLEAGPDSFLTRKPAAMQLCRDLGIDKRLAARLPAAAGSFVMHDHVLYPLPEGLSGLVPTRLDVLAESPLLSTAGRRRALQEPTIPPGAPREDESVADLLVRRFGQEVFDRLIEPLVSGIYAGDASLLSAEATYPHLRRIEREAGSLVTGLGSGSRSGSPSSAGHSSPAAGSAAGSAHGPAALAESVLPPFVSFPLGMEELVRALEANLAGITVVRGVGVESVTAAPRGFRVGLGDSSHRDVDAVILTTPAWETARLVGPMDGELCDLLAGIPFASPCLLHLGYRQEDLPRALDGYGYLIPRVEDSDLIACTWTSSKWEGRAPRGMALLRLYAGRFGRPGSGAGQGPGGDPDTGAGPEADRGASREARTDPDRALAFAARRELEATLGITASPVLSRMQRWDWGMPQYVMGHPRRVAAIEQRASSHPGLFLAGASYRGVGIPDCIESGMNAAAAAHLYLHGQGERP